MRDDPTSLTASVRLHQGNAAPQALVLVGFMGAGKTSVGRALAQRLGWSFEDLDDRIRSNEGRSIEDIFRQSGEAHFRKAERDALRQLLSEHGSLSRVIALGGGAFVQVENAAALEAAKVPTFFLDAPVEELFRRCAQDGNTRPLRRDPEQFAKLYESRRSYYLKAMHRIDTCGKNVEQVVNEIVEHLTNKGSSGAQN